MAPSHRGDPSDIDAQEIPKKATILLEDFIRFDSFVPTLYTAINLGHYCHICGRVRANEKFSGRGHRDHICKDCQRLPREERDRVTCLDELYGFLEQSHISQKNIDRLGILTRHADSEVRKLADLVLDIARAYGL